MTHDPPVKAAEADLPLYKKLLFASILFVVFLFLLILVGETAIRLFAPARACTTPPSPALFTAVKDDRLGWKMKPGFRCDTILKDHSGNEYPLSLRYDEHGFKAFGNIQSRKPKVLFIGDSYTASVEVSNKNSFFHHLQDSLDIEIFACGHAGYGTLQEYLLLDQWVDVIRPDLVVWQFCCNDFIDNYAPLEMVCGYNIGERRPYLQDGGAIRLITPLSTWQQIKKRIHFFQWLENHWHPFKKKVFGVERRFGEHFIATSGRDFEPFNKAINLTGSILDLIRHRLPANVRFFGFLADNEQPQMNEIIRICRERELPVSGKPALLVAETERTEGVCLRASDGFHWNAQGHAVVAKALAPEIRRWLGE